MRARSPIAHSSRRVCKQPRKLIQQAIGIGQLRLGQHLCRAGVAEDLSVAALVVVCGQCEGHQKRCSAGRAKLRHGAGAAATEEQVCGSKLARHLVQIRLHADSRPTSQTYASIGLGRRFCMARARLMHNLKISKLFEQTLRNLRHCLVQDARALAAAEDQKPQRRVR